MKHVFITGANGFIGQALCCRMLAKGWHVRGGIRSISRRELLPPMVETVQTGSIGPTSNWESALHGIDTVVHLASGEHLVHENTPDPVAAYREMNVAGTMHLARAAKSQNVRRFLFVSSAKVNGEGKTGAYTEEDTPVPVDLYAVSKYEAELALRNIADKTGLEIVIVRPPLVYGSNVKANFLRMLQIVDKGIPLPLANVQNRRSLIYLENLIDGIVTCMQHPKAANQTFLISDGCDVSISDLLQEIASAMGKPLRLFSFPDRILRLSAGLVGKSEVVNRLLDSFRLDISKINTRLSWTPPFTLPEGIRKTAHWYLEKSLQSTT